ncbi:hypothetical protein LCGC14_1336990 [marine sediment metagenome]|uniref:Uncharacterized protein n=1 Tax=marine sediment metagenome TaxID=412755 RepID=A0A0F9MVN7_9ZZZZ
MSEEEKEKITEILSRENIEYKFDNGKPDIELITDLILKYRLSDNQNQYKNLEDSIRKNILNIINSTDNPNLELHIKFLKSLKKLVGINPETLFIFTTNYDLLFELAAKDSRIPLFNGFRGILYRYFDINSLKLKYGTIENNRIFNPTRELSINLLKLHGSISWNKNGENISEIANYKSIMADNCSIILPRKQKIRDTLVYPYDNLFRYSSQVIGSSKCKYLISCGYSFRDEHINDLFIIPKLQEGKIRFFALFKDEPDNIDRFKDYSNFNYLTKDKLYLNGNESNNTTDIWKFSKFVDALASKAGV